MLFSRINLQSVLIRERNLQQGLLNEVYDLIFESVLEEKELLKRLRSDPTGEVTVLKKEAEPASCHLPSSGLISALEVAATPDENDEKLVFSQDEIKRICIRYRLRFLDSVFFKGDYPYEVLLRIKSFEKKYHTKVEHFKIIAPDHSFHLENINRDPLLFAKLNDDRYYLIHKWGSDLAWHKRFTLWPLQNLKTFLITILAISALLVLIIPSSVMNGVVPDSEVYLRGWLIIHIFIGLSAMSVWAGLTFNRTLSNMKWESRYYNS